ncbi:MAG: DNA translocase FtsK 4TM domain-containing protein [Azospirillaceae bacterium]
MRRRGQEAAGALLIGAALALALALATYHPGDPSWNTTGRAGPIGNLLGTAGSYPADLLIQTLGAAAWALIAVPAVWGLRLVRHLPLGRIWLRVIALVIGILAASLAVAPLAAPAGWTHQTSLGGAVGTILIGDIAARLVLHLGPVDHARIAAAGAGVALLALPVALGLMPREWLRLAGLLFRAIRLASGAAWAAGAGAGRLSGTAARHAARHAGTLARREPRLGDSEDAAGYEHEEPAAPARRRWRLPRPDLALGGLIRRRAERVVPPWDDDAYADRAPDPEDRYGAVDLGGGADPAEEERDAPPARRFEGIALRPDAGDAPAAAGGDTARGGPTVSPPAKAPSPGKRDRDERQAKLELEPSYEYELPPLSLLTRPDPSTRPEALDDTALKRNAELLEGVLGDFGVKGQIIRVNAGPVVTLYELEPAPGTKSSRVIGLADDIARSMSAVSVRVAVVPGKNAIGIELPNAKREIVLLRELLAAEGYEKSSGKLTLVLGKDIGGHPIFADLARMPHLLVAGTTGSGKSVAINTMILSLLYRLTPEKCRFIMVDPKMLELSIYDGIPHLLSPVVTDPKKAVVALKWTVREMEDRYRAMSKLGVRNVEGYNQRLREAKAKGETLTRKVQTGFDPDTGKPVFEDQPVDLTELPYIVVVVDEMADLMMVAGKDIEAAIQRLAQMARAAGIHLIMATQRPSVDVITGTIKANFPTRISFQVTSKIDSRTILGEGGAEQLLGQGDMLYMAGGGRITRVHGPFVSDREVEEVVAHLKAQGEPAYNDAVLEDDGSEAGAFDPFGGGGADGGGSGDDLYDRAVAIVARDRKASTSFIQRQLQIGYNRAARLIEKMEAEGVVSPANHVGKREVLVGNHGEE